MAEPNPYLAAANPQQFLQAQQNLPPELQEQARGITRQQQMANLLTGQAFNQPQGQMVSGRYVAPSFFQMLAPVAGAYFGGQAAESADKKQTALAAALRERNKQDYEKFSEAMSGVPADETTGRPAIAPDFKAAFNIAYNSYDPGLRAQAAEMIKSQKLGEGETITRFNMGTGKYETVAAGATKMPDTIKTAAMMVGLGNKDPNTWTEQERALVSRQVLTNKSASANNISVKLGGGLIENVKDIMKDAKNNVVTGFQNLDAANKLDNAINSGQVFVGPGATLGQSFAQLSSALNIAGATTEQKLANTRSTMQALAQMWLAGRKQMQGQGQITEGENVLAGKIQSGEIDKLSVPELRLMTEQVRKMGNYYLTDYNDKLKAIQSNPELKDIAPFFAVTPYPVTPLNTTGTPNQQTPAAPSSVRQRADQIVGG